MTWFIFLVGSLVTYRLALMLTDEDGPAYIFRKLRNVPPKKSSAHEGIRCIWCASVYFAAATATFFWWRGYFPGVEWPLYWLGLAGAAVGLNQMWTKD